MSAQIKDGGAVDVLAEMQADIDALEQRVLAGEFTLSRGYNKVNRLRSIHAAVAELIESAKEFSDLYGYLWDVAEPDGAGFLSPESVKKYDDAHGKLMAALAHCGGTK